ncbi:MAG: FAD:protein FMN transferase [Chitinispirillaceae bacterium]
MNFKKLLFVAIPLFSLIILSCSFSEKVHRKHLFFRMDTVSEVTLSVPKDFDVEQVWKKIDALLARSEKRFSVSRSESEIKALNERTEQTVPVSEDVGRMIRLGLDYGDTLNGAFDITVLPLKELWGLDEQAVKDWVPPDSAQVKKALSEVDYRSVSLGPKGDTVTFKSPDTRIDVGGIAKGYVLGQIGELVESFGISDYLVVAGGDIVSSGARADGTDWVIGVQHPRDRSRMLATLPLDRGALVTSGDYERYKMVDGKRYHHIFDIRSGYSCSENKSLTIWTLDPVVADIYSTGLFCYSASEILDFVQRRQDLECIVVDSAGKVHVSSGWKARVDLAGG